MPPHVGRAKIVHVLHEYRPVVPADDVVVESIDRVDCYQAKHANDPHALLTFQDLVAMTDLQLQHQTSQSRLGSPPTVWERGVSAYIHQPCSR